eukprot:4938772-Pleurochrysis_carterae.AAC.1
MCHVHPLSTTRDKRLWGSRPPFNLLCLRAGEESARGRGGLRALDVPAQPPGRAIMVTRRGGDEAALDEKAREGREG